MADSKTTPKDATPGASAPDPGTIDDISLRQALLDVDVANARVIDLTRRLTTLNKELRQTTNDLQKTRLRNRQLSTELDEIKGSRAFRSATTAQRVLGAARSRLGK